MLSVIIGVLRLALGPLTIAQAMLAGLDDNDEGIDDKLAQGLQQAIDLILGVVSQDDSIPGQARGLEAITVAVARCNTRLDEIIAAGPPFEASKAEAQSLVNDLSNNAKVYQAKRGKDADVLKKGQADAQAKLAVIFG